MDRGEQLMEALNELIHKKEALDRLTWRTVARDLNPTELRCVEYIGRRAGVNATRLAEAFSMTTGAASKLTKRLLARDLVTRYQKLENRKEVYFRLSPQGEELFAVLAEIRAKLNRRDEAIFTDLDEGVYDAILRFARTYSNHLDSLARRRAYPRGDAQEY